MLDCILLIQEWDRCPSSMSWTGLPLMPSSSLSECPRTPHWLILSFHVDHAAALPYVMEKVRKAKEDDELISRPIFEMGMERYT